MHASIWKRKTGSSYVTVPGWGKDWVRLTLPTPGPQQAASDGSASWILMVSSKTCREFGGRTDSYLARWREKSSWSMHVQTHAPDPGTILRSSGCPPSHPWMCWWFQLSVVVATVACHIWLLPPHTSKQMMMAADLPPVNAAVKVCDIKIVAFTRWLCCYFDWKGVD